MKVWARCPCTMSHLECTGSMPVHNVAQKKTATGNHSDLTPPLRRTKAVYALCGRPASMSSGPSKNLTDSAVFSGCPHHLDSVNRKITLCMKILPENLPTLLLFRKPSSLCQRCLSFLDSQPEKSRRKEFVNYYHGKTHNLSDSGIELENVNLDEKDY